MAVKNKLVKRVLSTVLATTMVLSTALSVSLTANAGAGQEPDSAGFVGGGNTDWTANFAKTRFVMRINASSITDDTPVEAMSNFETRYGDGKTSFYDFPLFMQLGNTADGHTVNHLNGVSFDNNSYITEDTDEIKTTSKLYNDIVTEYSHLNTKYDKDWRAKHSNEYTGYITTSYTQDGVKRVGVKNHEKTVYLEDLLYNAYTAYEKNKINYEDLRCFWYLYTRFAVAAKQDWGRETHNDLRGLGNSLQEKFITGDYAVQKSPDRESWIQHGYSVALYLAYGAGESSPYKLLIGEDTFQHAKKDKGTYTYPSWVTDKANNRVRSLEVEKLVTDYLDDRDYNSVLFTNTLLSIPKYCKLLLQYRPGNSEEFNYLQEMSLLAETNTNYHGYWEACPVDSVYDVHPSSLWYSIVYLIERHLFPTRANGAECQIYSYSTYAGWGYFEVTPDAPPPPKNPPSPVPAKDVSYENTKQIAAELTYNAFLATKNNTQWTEELSNKYNLEPNAIDVFANNGHIMSDTICITKPISESTLAKTRNEPVIVGDYRYLTTKVDSTISLSAPVKDTTYKLKRLSYQITDAGGANKAISSTNPVKIGDKSIAVSGEDIKKAFDSADITYSYRLKQPLNFPAIKKGYCATPKVNKTDEFDFDRYYYIYKYNGSGYDAVTTDNGEPYTTGGILLGNITKNPTKKYNVNVYDADDWLCRTKGLRIYPYGWYYDNMMENTKYDANDLNKNSSNCYYIKIKGKYYPIIMENKTWYICPVVSVKNLLVQFRADYVADFGKGTENYNSTYKAINIPEYLVTQNNSSSEFTKKNKNLYSMIDNYVTGQSGSISLRSYFFSNNSTNALRKISENNTYSYTKLSQLQYDGRPVGTQTIGNEYTWNPEELKLGLGYSYSGKTTKVKYIEQLKESMLNFVTQNDFKSTFMDDDLSVLISQYKTDNKNLRYTYSKVPRSGDIFYTEVDQNNNRNTKLIGVADIPKNYDIATIMTKNTKSALAIPSDGFVKQIAVPNKKTARKTLGFTNDYGINVPGLVFKTNRTDVNENASSTVDDTFTGYKEWYFTKLLTSYEQWVYNKKGWINEGSTPNIAKFMYTKEAKKADGTIDSTKPQLEDTKDADGNLIKQGLKSKYGMGASSIGKGIASYKNQDGGFVRFGSTTAIKTKVNEGKPLTNADGTVQTIRSQKLVLNINALPGAIHTVSLNSGNVTSNIKHSALFNNSYVRLPLQFTQSSYDIPLVYNVNAHKTKSITNQVVSTEYKKTDNVYTQVYQYNTNKTGVNKDGSNNASLGVYPEVIMWAEPNNVSNKAKPSVNQYGTVITVGEKQRYIPATTYTNLSFNRLDNSVQVNGTAVAFDTRAKSLAKKLGTADTQVLYSGSGINGAFKTSLTGNIQTYVIDFQGGGILNGIDIRTAWGNSGYKSENVASAAMTNLLSNFKVTNNQELGIYTGTKFSKQTINKSSDESLKATDMTADGYYYQLTIKGGEITKIEVKRQYYTSGSNPVWASVHVMNLVKNGTSTTSPFKVLDYYSGNAPTNAPASVKNELTTLFSNNNNGKTARGAIVNQINTALINMKLVGADEDNVLKKAFERNTGVILPDGLKNSSGNKGSYNEDCSVIQIKSYSAIVKTSDNGTFSEQIPITLGPATNVDKNHYFENGFAGFVTGVTKLVLTKNMTFGNAGKVLMTASTTHKAKSSTEQPAVVHGGNASTLIPDFIIADVPISEATVG